MFFTFDKVAKAEYELRIVNQKAAETLKVQEAKPDDAGALAAALKNYTGAGERFQSRLTNLKQTSENPNFEKLLQKVDEQTLKHAVLLNQLAERWNTDPYVEDSARAFAIGDPDFDLIANAVKDAQGGIKETVVAASEREKDIKGKAEEQMRRAEVAISEFEAALAKFIASDANVSNDSSEKTAPVRLDPTPARISTNLTIERQTPKRDFGDRMKAGLDTAGGMLANAKAAFEGGKYGEAFGLARSAEVTAINGLRALEGILRPDLGGLEDGKAIAPPKSGETPTVPKPVTGVPKKVLPPVEKRVTPETNKMLCVEIFDPVCGLNGETYSNECKAKVAGVTVKSKGACVKPKTSNNTSLKFEVTPQVDISTDSIKVKTDGGSAVIISRVWDVVVTDEGFSPKELKVKKGDTVVWTNKGSSSSWPASAMHPTHSVYPEQGGCISSTFDACRGLNLGEAFKFVFNQVGSWSYHDHLNPSHFGKVVVE